MKVVKELVDDGVETKTQIKIDDKYSISVDVPYRILKSKENEVVDIISKAYWKSFSDVIITLLKKEIEGMFIIEMRREKLKKLNKYEQRRIKGSF